MSTSNCFTVDVEDWFQGMLHYNEWPGHAPRLEHGFNRVMELLNKYNAKGTFFILGAVAEKYPHLIKQLANEGHELGSHSYTHEYVYKQPPEVFREEIKRTKAIVEDLSGKPCVSHRSPFFSVTAQSLWALDILAEEGFTTDTSINPVKTWIYGISTCPDTIFKVKENGLIEFPMSKFSILSKNVCIGGAYFRLFPYWLSAYGMKKRQSQGLCNNFYIHPWEYDPHHPRIELQDKGIKFGHYVNLGKTYGNTEKMLRQFKFDTMSNVIRNYTSEKGLQEVSIDLLKKG
jgi:polysaccharide deacetylase family protein (PEP-CTERM system associated)